MRAIYFLLKICMLPGCFQRKDKNIDEFFPLTLETKGFSCDGDIIDWKEEYAPVTNKFKRDKSHVWIVIYDCEGSEYGVAPFAAGITRPSPQQIRKSIRQGIDAVIVGNCMVSFEFAGANLKGKYKYDKIKVPILKQLVARARERNICK